MRNVMIVLAMILIGFTACKSAKETVNNEQQPTETRGDRSERGAKMEERFARLDTNGDGKLSKSEVKGPLAREFDKVDTDGDGFISKVEMEKAPKPKRGNRGQRNN